VCVLWASPEKSSVRFGECNLDKSVCVCVCECVFVFRSFFLVVICPGDKYLPEFLEQFNFVLGLNDLMALDNIRGGGVVVPWKHHILK
jgi:hypothetical protein